MRNFSGTAVLVTGCSRGIGAALVHSFSEMGARVYGCATGPTSTNPLLHQYFQCDVGDPASVAAMFAAISASETCLHAVVHNASVLGPRGPLDELEWSEWRRVLNTNLDGSFLVMTQSLPLLRAAQNPVLAGITSSVGRKGRGTWGAYSVSKHGLEGICEILTDETAGEVTVLSINPGGTRTDMRAEAAPDEDPQTLPTADSVADRIVLMCLENENSGAKLNVRDSP